MPTQEDGDIEFRKQPRTTNCRWKSEERSGSKSNLFNIRCLEVDAAKVVVYKQLLWNCIEDVGKVPWDYICLFGTFYLDGSKMKVAMLIFMTTPNITALESFDISVADKKLDSLTGTDKPSSVVG